ncbi:hypothetical protein [Ancylobacter amanitiformis]|uniref:Uncharacterized protein n=1 Tax=Ancylobacter amanitiformis TaxID=217069 RepID=A0ABU0LP58_9HYPH|nr:hypothetical protein [Ancylobacter amanitiformis]MDQ0510488.1 hypothetical protein [Ancylobacter amanitiformis]
MMTTITSRAAGALKAGLLALSLVSVGAGAASAHGFGGGGGHFGGGHMGGGFGEHLGGGEFHGGFRAAPAFHAEGYGSPLFLPHALHVHEAFHGVPGHYGFPLFRSGYAFAPYDVFRDDVFRDDVGPNCFDRVVKLGTRGHYHYAREDSCG